MSKGMNLITTVITSLIISVIVSAGFLYIAIPIVYPSSVDSSALTFVQMKKISINNELSINDEDLIFERMDKSETFIIIKNQSSIVAQFTGNFITSIYFIDRWGFEISLVIQGVGNHTVSIIRTGTSDIINQYNSHNVVINYLTQPLPAGNYSVRIYWRSIFSQSGAAYLRTYYYDENSTQSTTTRTLTLWEIANGN